MNIPEIDPKQCSAEFEVTPYQLPDGIVYEVHSELRLRPYPNNEKYGGYCFLPFDTRDIEEVKQYKDRFLADVKKHGITNVVIKENPVKLVQKQEVMKL
jgi:hypothetical protein